MSSKIYFKIFILAAIILLVIGTQIRVRYSLLPLVESINYQSDDSFYYYQIAKNFARGDGITFDGMTLNNGFHPLFFAICAICFKLISSFEGPIAAALVISSIFNALAAIVLFFFIYYFTKNKLLSLFSVTFWFFNPHVFNNTLNGLETSVYLFCLFLTFYYYHAFYKKEDSVKNSFYLGLLIGASFLARTEAIFLAVLIPADIFINKICAMKKEKIQWRKLFLKLSIIPGGFCLISSPWLIWNLLQFHTIQQVSGQHLRLNRLSYILDFYKTTVADYGGNLLNIGLYQMPLRFVNDFFWWISSDIILKLIRVIGWSSLVVAVLLFIFTLLKKILLKNGDAMINLRVKALVCDIWSLKYYFVYVAILLSYYSYYQFSISMRYMMVYIPLLLIASTLFIHHLYVYGLQLYLNKVKVKYLKEITAFCLIFLMFVCSLRAYERFDQLLNSSRPEYHEFWKTGEYMKNNFPPDTVFGGYNCGIFAFISERTVVNLDGIVNPEAYESLRDHRHYEYILRKDIDYLVDAVNVIDPTKCPEAYFYRFDRSEYNNNFYRYFERVYHVPDTHFYGGMGIYKVNKDNLREDFL